MKEKIGCFLNFIYLFLWIIPFYFLIKDFFKIEDFSLYLDERTIKITQFSIGQALLSTLFAFLIALIPAYYISMRDGKLAQIVENTLFIPFFFPVISAVISFSLLYSSNGILERIGIKTGLMYDIKGVILAHVIYNSPIFIKYIGDALRKIPEEIRETARIDGANSKDIFFHIELPLILPAILKGILIVFIYSFTSFGIMYAIGGGKFTNLEVAIATELRGTMEFSRALVYAMIQFVLISFISVLLYQNSTEMKWGEAKKKKTRKIFPIAAVAYIILEYSFVLIGVAASFFDFKENIIDFSGITALFSEKINTKFQILQSILNSVMISFSASILMVAGAYVFIKLKNKFTDFIIISTMGISSAFIAIGLLYMNILFGIKNEVLLILGYSMVTLPIVYSYIQHHIESFDYKIIEAAKIDGAGVVARLIYIEIPTLFNIFIAAFMQGFALLYGEFTIAYTMQMDNSIPLASIVNFSMESQRLYRESAAFSMINLMIVVILFGFSGMLIKKYREMV